MKKLELKKKTIAALSDVQKSKIIGGDDAYTTSHSNCTHFLCCPDDCGTTECPSDECPSETNLPLKQHAINDSLFQIIN